jgi:hypothetical protein
MKSNKNYDGITTTQRIFVLDCCREELTFGVHSAHFAHIYILSKVGTGAVLVYRRNKSNSSNDDSHNGYKYSGLQRGLKA